MLKDEDSMSRNLYGDLRDFFAANAMQIVLQETLAFSDEDKILIDGKQVAEAAYNMAESMMVERERKYGVIDRQKQTENLQ